MKATIKIEYRLSKKDYQIIKAALKQNKTTCKSVYTSLGISKSNFYDQVTGKVPASSQLLEVINKLNVNLVFEGVNNA